MLNLPELREHADELASKNIPIPAIPPGAACVYAEWHAPDAPSAEATLLTAADLLPAFGLDEAQVLVGHVGTHAHLRRPGRSARA